MKLYCSNCRRIFPGQSSSQSTTPTLQSCQSAVGTANNPDMMQSSIVSSFATGNQRFLSCWPNASVNYGSIKKAPARKKQTYQFQPYKVKETWTHEFCVLADKDQRKVPTTSMKQKLREVGLGQKSIIFKNKKGNFDHMQEVLYSHYPKLKESRGFEFYRQGSGKCM